MALHAVKPKRNKLLIIILSILGFVALLSWSWVILNIPAVSQKAEGYILKYFPRVMAVYEKIVINTWERAIAANTDASITVDNDKNDGQSSDSGISTNENGSSSAQTDQEDNNGPKRPSIDLQISEGPKYIAESDECYYIVQAVVTGNPRPVIIFSKDDSGGSLGSDRAQVNLKRNMKTYSLTATASNDYGTAMDSITLNWGCNSSPVISEISVSSDIVYVNQQYQLIVTATDPDGDSLTYKWSVSGGSLEFDDQSTVKWNTPSQSGDYDVLVIIEDGKGANTKKNISVFVGDSVPPTTQPPATTQPPVTTQPPSTTEPPATTETTGTSLNLSKVAGEGGFVEYGGSTNAGGNIFAGDSASNKPCAGFISFDISGLAGKTVDAATLTMTGATVHDNPLSYLDAFWINVVYWGLEPVNQNDFTLTGVAVQSFTNPAITCTASTLKNELQSAINSGKARFQLRFHFSGPYTDNDSTKDGWEYSQANINLNVTVR